MIYMKFFEVAIFIAVLNFIEIKGFRLGGRFTRESGPDDGIKNISELKTTNVEASSTPSPYNITMIPLKTDQENSASDTANITDLEADKFIESLKNQSNGIKMKDKNETHISSTDSSSAHNIAYNITENATSIDNGANGSSDIGGQSNSSSALGGNSQPIEGHMFQNENVSLSQSPVLYGAENGTIIHNPNGTNIEKGLNLSCPSDCSADSCKPECSFHCCLKEKSSVSNDSLAGLYRQDSMGNVTGGLAFDSSKLEKMLLDTISEFSKTLPNNQQAQKLSEIMTDPSNHYAYAPSYDAPNSNRYNFMEQMSNPYLSSGSNVYLNGGTPNSNNYLKTYGYNMDQNYALKSQINPAYPYKRNQLSDQNYPIASTHHRAGNQGDKMAQAFLYNPNTNKYQSRKLYKRARIYSPFKSPY